LFFRSASPKPVTVINPPIVDITEISSDNKNNNNNKITERMPKVPELPVNKPADKHAFELFFEPIEDAPPPPTKQQPLQNPDPEIPIKNSLSEYFSNFEAPFSNYNRQDSAGNSTTSSICSLPPSPVASPKLAKRKINELAESETDPPIPKNCLETCPIEDFEDSLEFLFSL
jgi:hypothetical protein